MMLRYKLNRKGKGRVDSRAMRAYMRSIEMDNAGAIASNSKNNNEEEEDDDNNNDKGGGAPAGIVPIPIPSTNENKNEQQSDDEEITFYASNRQMMGSIEVPSPDKFNNNSGDKNENDAKKNSKGNEMATKVTKDVSATKKNSVVVPAIIGGNDDGNNNNINNSKKSIIIPVCDVENTNTNNLNTNNANNNSVVVPSYVPIIGIKIAATPVGKYSTLPLPRGGIDSRYQSFGGTRSGLLPSSSSLSSSFPFPPSVSPETNMGATTPKSPPKRVSIEHNIGLDNNGYGHGNSYGNIYDNSGTSLNSNNSMTTMGMSTSSTVGMKMMMNLFTMNDMIGIDGGSSVIGNSSINNSTHDHNRHYDWIGHNHNLNLNHNRNYNHNYNHNYNPNAEHQIQQRHGKEFGAVVPATTNPTIATTTLVPPAPPSTPTANVIANVNANADNAPPPTPPTTTNMFVSEEFLPQPPMAGLVAQPSQRTFTAASTLASEFSPPPMVELVAQTSQRTFTAASTLVSMSTKLGVINTNSPNLTSNNKRSRADHMLFELSINNRSDIGNITDKKQKRTHRHKFSNILDQALSLTHDISTAATIDTAEKKDKRNHKYYRNDVDNDIQSLPHKPIKKNHSSNKSTASTAVADAGAPVVMKKKTMKMIQQDINEDNGYDVDDAATTTTGTSRDHNPFKRIPRRFVDDPSLSTIKVGMRLAVSNDQHHLNSLHCFVRSELLEVFVLDDLEGVDVINSLSTDNNHRKRVGLRCVYCGCKNKVEKNGTSMSTFFPKSVNDIYRGVCTWQRIHFKKCSHIPEHLKEKYGYLKDSDRTRGKKLHWVSSARDMGFRDVDENRSGVIYDPDNGEVHVAAAAVAASKSPVKIAATTMMSQTLAEYQASTASGNSY